jgi:nicotinate-nucleotide adenylyltransferase
MMRRIGLFGGSFNPVHLGHMLVAQAAFEEAQLDHLAFVPASQSPFKPGAVLASAEQRLRLLRIALAGQAKCTVDEQEIHRGGVSYTIETVRTYVSRFPEALLFYLIGADHVTQLSKWREAHELAGLVEFLIIPRPGAALAPLGAPFQGRTLSGFPLGVSASQIRDRVRAGLSIDWLVPPGVAEAICNNRLYL